MTLGVFYYSDCRYVCCCLFTLMMERGVCLGDFVLKSWCAARVRWNKFRFTDPLNRLPGVCWAAAV